MKVPLITPVFWIIKVLTTGMGESASDFAAQKSLWVSAIIGAVALGVALRLQFRSARYHAPTYWFTVAMVAIFGTVLADMFNSQAGGFINLPLPVTAGIYAILLSICFLLWYRSEGTLSIHTIDTPRREAFYWLTVLLTFALGTSVGDVTAFYLNIGFAQSALWFAAAMMVPLIAYKFGVNSILTFWTAYVLTRPLGASLADWLGKAKPLGVGFGDGNIVLVAAILVVAIVTALTLTGYGDPQPRRREARALPSAV